MSLFHMKTKVCLKYFVNDCGFSTDNKQIFQAFLFNIRNYSPEVINIQRRKTELNITLPTVNNFDIKQKKGMEYLFYYMPPTPNNIWQDKDQQNSANFGQNTSFFCKN